jgi:hypothetical protein
VLRENVLMETSDMAMATERRIAMDQRAQQLESDSLHATDFVSASHPGDACDGASGWQSLSPEILDRVLDPEAID